MEERAWERPKACADAGNCPEVAIADEAVHLRSTLRPDAVVRLTPAEWQTLQRGIRNGEFD
ncbi:DUF397 domain-containing protein [Kitasatospora sp. NPDC004240]